MMPWVKLDTGIFRNPKIVTIGADAKLLYIAGICYAGDNLTDGLIPANAVTILGAEANVRNTKRATNDLIAAGLWIPVDGGFDVHDYLEHNSRSLDVQSKRDAAKERMQRMRSQDVRANKTITDDEQNAKFAKSSPSIEGRRKNKEVEEGDKPPKPPTPAKPPAYSVEFDSFWQAYPAGHGVKKTAFDAWKRINPDNGMVMAIIDGVHGWQQCERWRSGFVMDAQRWLRERAWESVPPPMGSNMTRLNARAPNGTHAERTRAAAERAIAMLDGEPPPPDDDVIDTHGRITG